MASKKPEFEYTLKNVIADIIDDRAKLVVEPERFAYIDNTMDVAELIMKAIEEFKKNG